MCAVVLLAAVCPISTSGVPEFPGHSFLSPVGAEKGIGGRRRRGEDARRRVRLLNDPEDFREEKILRYRNLYTYVSAASSLPSSSFSFFSFSFSFSFSFLSSSPTTISSSSSPHREFLADRNDDYNVTGCSQ